MIKWCLLNPQIFSHHKQFSHNAHTLALYHSIYKIVKIKWYLCLDNRKLTSIFQVEAYWCFRNYLQKIQHEFTEEGMVSKIGQLLSWWQNNDLFNLVIIYNLEHGFLLVWYVLSLHNSVLRKVEKFNSVLKYVIILWYEFSLVWYVCN